MILLGVLLLILGFVFGIGILFTLGLVLIVIGVVLLCLGHFHGPVGGRRYWW